MENTIRLVLLMVGAIIILAILWDGLRRKKRLLSNMKKKIEADEEEIEITMNESIDQPFLSEKSVEEPRVISIYLVAQNNRHFNGYELLQALLNHGLHYGEMHLFHYYTHSAKSEKPIFSIAAATKSGEFNLAQINDFCCKGLILFMDSSQQTDARISFDKMVEIAILLAEEIEGVLMADRNKSWTEEVAQSIRSSLK